MTGNPYDQRGMLKEHEYTAAYFEDQIWEQDKELASWSETARLALEMDEAKEMREAVRQVAAAKTVLNSAVNDAVDLAGKL